MDTVIKVENLSKQYRLGEVGTGTLRNDLTRWWAKMRGKEDPFLKIGEANDRTQKGNSDYVWALKDLNFEVKQGDVVGIIGRNGAGKSTLLKILSKTTLPTTGAIKIKGRIASLLEVGTGFHPDLSGRDNIFLNGAILGMTKREIQSKFDEIVAFAGVERYIDTPVKRYSSGMYVRLAFAVAAHLDPEILIVDEVLAVGDAEFQKKAIGKMKSVSEEGGRTVLFVSHNMGAVENLCTSGIYMKNGKIEKVGLINDVIDEYLKKSFFADSLSENMDNRGGTGQIRISDIITSSINTDEVSSVFRTFEQIKILIKLKHIANVPDLNIVFSIYNEKEVLIANVSNQYSGFNLDKDKEQIDFSLDLPFCKGSCYANIVLFGGMINSHPIIYDKIEKYPLFSIEGGDPFNTGLHPNSGVIILKPEWY